MDYNRMHMQSYYILLCIQIMLHHKDRLLLAIIWSSKMLIAAKGMGRARSKIQSIYSRGGVPQVCLILRSEGCNVCARRRQWDNKWRPCQRRQRQWRRCGDPNKLFQHWLEQNMSDVVLIIALRQFWLRRIFFGKQALPKNRGAYVDNQNWHQPVWPVWPSGLTGMTERSDRSRRCGLSGRGRPVWPVQVESEYN